MKRTCPIGVVLLVLGTTMPCLAQSRDPGVRDSAKMFSTDAVDKANEHLKALQRDGGWQVVIETIDALKNQTIEERAIADAKAMNTHGLVVVISKADHKLEVQPSRSAEKVFSKEKVTGIAKILRDAFRDQQYDKGLRDAVNLIEDDARVVGVRDTAKMFSADAVKKANAALKTLRQKSTWQVIIETVDSLDGQTAAQRAVANGKAMNVHGLSIVISKTDHKLEVEPSDSARKVFSKEKLHAITETFKRDFKANEFDKGLQDAVAAIETDAAQSAVASNALAKPVSAEKAAAPVVPAVAQKSTEVARVLPPPLVAQQPPVPAAEPVQAGSKLPILIVGGVGILFLLWIVSRATRRREPMPPPAGWQQQPQQPQPGYAPQGARPVPPQGYGPPPPGYGPGYGPPPPQGGGGMGSFAAGALGGLGGAIAGNILYDQFGRPHHGGSPGVASPEHTAGGVFPPSQPNAPIEPPRETFDPNAGASADWGGDENQPAPDQWGGGEPANASGDWGGNEPDAGNWGGSDQGAEPSGDWGGDAGTPDDGGGGDWGGDAPDTPDQDQGGGW